MSMPGRSRVSLHLSLPLVFLQAFGAIRADDPEAAPLGVMVEEVAKDSAGARAGIQAGRR